MPVEMHSKEKGIRVMVVVTVYSETIPANHVNYPDEKPERGDRLPDHSADFVVYGLFPRYKTEKRRRNNNNVSVLPDICIVKPAEKHCKEKGIYKGNANFNRIFRNQSG